VRARVSIALLLLDVVTILVAWLHGPLRRDVSSTRPLDPADAGPPDASAAEPPPSLRFRRIELDGAARGFFQGHFAYHDLLPAPAFEVTSPSGETTTILFLRLPEVARAGFAAPMVGAMTPLAQSPQRVELTGLDEGNLVAVEAFDVRDMDGDGRPELLFVARFESVGDGPVRQFRRGFELGWRDDWRLVKTLASWELREDTSIDGMDALVARLAALHAKKHCPDLSARMDNDTTIAAVRCMVENDERRQLAASMLYPLQVLLPSGEVRTLAGPLQLLEVYDGVIDAHVREALRQGMTEPNYWGLRIGRAALIVDEGKIGPLFNPDPEANRRMNEGLAGQRSLWRVGPRDDTCRTSTATHVFSFDPSRGSARFQLSTWFDPKADVTKRPPDRVLFGLMESHGTCGNSFFTFLGPDGDVGYEHIMCYGPDPTPEYSVTGGRGAGPCLDHRMLP